ncbi:MAG: hypothetical protein ACUVRX_08960 [Actinomycetota bacterium]
MVRCLAKWSFPVSLVLALLLALTLPAATAMGDETTGESQAPTLSQLREELEEFLTLFGRGEVGQALEVLERYLQDLKMLSEAEGALSGVESHVAHVLYVTSKHLVVLARVYQNAPEAARKGLGKAIVSSGKGHAHFYVAVESRQSGEESGLIGEGAPGTGRQGRGNDQNPGGSLSHPGKRKKRARP